MFIFISLDSETQGGEFSLWDKEHWKFKNYWHKSKFHSNTNTEIQTLVTLGHSYTILYVNN